MKKVILGLLICTLGIFGKVYADSETTEDIKKISITTKQGYVYVWDTQEVENLTAFEIIKTKKIDSIGNWNLFWDGWSLDAGFSYGSSDILNTGALLIGRNFGTLGDYLPIAFPLKDYITITIYPIGLYINDLFHSPEIDYCSGLGFIKAEIRF